MEWLKNLSYAIEYIENNLDNDISYEEAARIACCSTYYFQRIFSYTAGISLSDYIRRRRMTQAAFELQRTEAKVIDVAFKYGYTSPTAFNRAFQNVHGITPAAAKHMGSTLNAYPRIKFSVTVTGGNAMSYHIAQKESMRLVGIRTPLEEDMDKNHKSVPIFWNHILKSPLFSQICELSSQNPKGILGVSMYRNSNDFYYYIAASTDKAVPENMYEFEIPAATWVIFENDGRFKENIQNVFKRFYMEWLPFSGYEYAGLPDLELYPVNDDKSSGGHSEVWIGIRKEKEN